MKRLIPDLGQEMYKNNLECFVVPESKEVLIYLCQKDSGGNWKRLLLAKDGS